MGFQSAPYPIDEEERLQALEWYQILDSEPEPEFDDLAQLAADLCNVPGALITFVDRERQWHKSAVGYASKESSRGISFCAHTILSDELLVVENTTEDPRFADHPAVTSTGGIRFYAGAPLKTPLGQRIGTLCVFDTKPHRLEPRQDRGLRKLSRLIIAQLELRAQRLRHAELNAVLERRESDFATTSAVNHAILTNAGFAIIASDASGRIELFNPAAQRLLGYTEAEITGTSAAALHDADELSRRAAEFSALLGSKVTPTFDVLSAKTRQGLENEHEWTLVHKNGRRIPVLLSVTALRTPGDKIFGYLGVAVDISTQTRLRSEIEAREGQLKAFIDHAPASVAMFDTSLRYIACSKRWLDDYNLGDRDLTGLSHYDVFPEIGEEWKRKHQRCLAGAIEKADEERFIRADGSEQWIKWEVRPWYLPRGDVGGIAMLTEDITQRKKLTDKLRIASETAIAATAVKSQFLANVSHEIRTPLTAIIGFAEVAQEPNLSTEERNGALRTIQNSGEHLLGVINDILDLSKIGAGALRIETLPVCPTSLVEEVRRMMLPHVADKSLSLTVNYRWPLPGEIQTDPLRLKQVLTNLLANAIKFTSRGWIEISVSCDAAQNKLQFTISDTGIGLDAEQMEHLFEPFSQADSSTTRRFGGTGLGLSISEQLVNRLGGTIAVESVKGRGSTFSFAIGMGPLSSEWLESVPQPKGAPRALSTDPQLLVGRVLVADDAPDNRRLLERALQRTNLELTLVENGQLALDALNSNSFDIILLDMQMPVMDGYTAVREMRKRGFKQPIVAFSASTTKNHILRCIDAGCTSHLAKPFAQAELFDLLAKYLLPT